MKTALFEVPAMYGDHHVIEIRRILLEMPGVENIYASSSFGIVEVTYDPGKIDEEHIRAKFEEAGYLGEWVIPTEVTQDSDNHRKYFRHTSVYEGTRQGVSFAQDIGSPGRALWPCPGLGIVKVEE